MSVIMDNRLENSDKEEEVKKLQELVKKLEIQNEELRSERQTLLKYEKENRISEENNCDNSSSGIIKYPLGDDTKEKLQLIENLPLEHLEQQSDEETWLFESPETQPHSTDWLRKDFDDPSLIPVKKNLINKLDEIANSPRHSPRHSLYSPSSSSGVLSPESPPSSRGEIDTRTFIRPKKRRSIILDNHKEDRNAVIKESNGFVPNVKHRDGSREHLMQSNGSFGSEEEDRLSSASDGSYSSYRLADVEDINTLARLQEESLKLPEASLISRLQGMRGSVERISPPAAPLSKVSPPMGSSGGSAASSQEDLLNCPFPVHCSPRRVIPRSSLQPPKRYFSGIRHPTSREGSDISTPPDSPYNSQNDLESCNARNVVGSRLPSLTRRLGNIESQSNPHTPRGVSPRYTHEPPLSKTPERRPAPVRTSRLQSPQAKGTSRLSAPSPVRVPLGAPQLSELPRLRPVEPARSKSVSALPKPGSRLQQPPPPGERPSSQPHAAGAQYRSPDWREGCY